MICGIYNPQRDFSQSPQLLSLHGEALGPIQTFTRGPVGLIVTPTGVPSLDEEGALFQDESAQLVVAFQGRVFNRTELWKELSSRPRGDKPTGELIAQIYQRYGPDAFVKLNGSFAVALWDGYAERLVLARDHLGIETLYYGMSGEALVFSSSLKKLIENLRRPATLNREVLRRYLLFNYNPGQDTIFQGAMKLRPAHMLICRANGREEQRYWYLSYKRHELKAETDYRQELLELLANAVRLRSEIDSKTIGAFLSGGLDSSTVVALLKPLVEDLHTFSFRCEGKSFDESHYALLMSRRYATIHHQVEFPPEKVDVIAELVESQDEPFCDIGIEVASYLLGQECGKFVPCVLSGDGGDELFAGHPVYLADKAVQKFDHFPSFIRKPIAKVLTLLPDSNRKKSLLVKAKRFAYSYSFPATLYSNRWRIYYTEDELAQLCGIDDQRNGKRLDAFSELRALYDEADGADHLSKALYGDYHTVVDFYLRRMALIKTFGVEARFPMLDYRVVEYAAGIPSDLKIRGRSDTKYILRKSLEGILPDEIVFRKDKLGHSVPMKNWMRESSSVRNLIQDVLSERSIRSRGLFNAKYIQRMMTEHFRKTHNHSHRLWALTVLELWLRKRGI